MTEELSKRRVLPLILIVIGNLLGEKSVTLLILSFPW